MPGKVPAFGLQTHAIPGPWLLVNQLLLVVVLLVVLLLVLPSFRAYCSRRAMCVSHACSIVNSDVGGSVDRV